MELVVDETDGSDAAADGVVTANFGGDGSGMFMATDASSFTFGGSTGEVLTAGGEEVVVTLVDGSYVGTAGGETIFTLDVAADGTTSFTLVGQLDHADDTDANDIINLSFGVKALDADGDAIIGEVSVQVADDGPSINNKFSPTDESGLVDGPIGFTRSLQFDFGADGEGTIEPTGGFAPRFQAGVPADTPLTSNGVEVVVEVNAAGDGYVGTAGGETIFTLVIDPQSGEHTYTQFAGLDHPDGDNPGDVLWLRFEVSITDADGDSATATIGVDVHDAAPIAEDDYQEFNLSDGLLEGNVIDNDELSTDAANTVTQVKFGDTVIDVPTDGSDVSILGDNGILTIDNTGDYTYTSINQFVGNTYVYSIDNPPGSDNGGDIKNVSTTFNDDTNEFTFSLTVEDISEGFTVAINNGANPKGHEAEMALIYFDASGADPVVSIYAYNGANAQNSWFDGSTQDGVQPPDQILNSIANSSLFSNISATVDADGNNVFSFAVDATTIQEHDPLYGPDGDWTGVAFDEQIGVWLHPVRGLDAGYDDDGFLEQWSIDGQGWFDTAYQDADVVENSAFEGPFVEDIFEYVLTDFDGDTSTAELKIQTNNDAEAGNIEEDVSEPNIIIGESSEYEVLYGTEDADVFLYQSITDGVDIIEDFELGEDLVDLSAIISGYDAEDLTQDIADFVITTEVDGATQLYVDQSGNGGAQGATKIAEIKGVSGADLEDLLKIDTTLI